MTKEIGNGANLGFEDRLWAAADDKLHGNMDAAEYKHVVLGLIFLKYISFIIMPSHCPGIKAKPLNVSKYMLLIVVNLVHKPLPLVVVQ